VTDFHGLRDYPADIALVKVKVKVKVKIKFTPEQATKDQKRGTGIAILFL
jgi:hypothetical protein